MTKLGRLRAAGMPVAVIARSGSDEAIHAFACRKGLRKPAPPRNNGVDDPSLFDRSYVKLQAGKEPVTIHVVQMWSKATECRPPSAAGSEAPQMYATAGPTMPVASNSVPRITL